MATVLAAGTLSGSLQAVVAAPMELAKIRLQVQVQLQKTATGAASTVAAAATTAAVGGAPLSSSASTSAAAAASGALPSLATHKPYTGTLDVIKRSFNSHGLGGVFKYASSECCREKVRVRVRACRFR